MMMANAGADFPKFAIRLSNAFCEFRKVLGTGKLVIPDLAGPLKLPPVAQGLQSAALVPRGFVDPWCRKMGSHGIWYARNELVKSGKC